MARFKTNCKIQVAFGSENKPEITFKTVDARKVSLHSTKNWPKGWQFFVYSEQDNNMQFNPLTDVVVVEGSTGMSIARGRNMTDAVRSTNARIDNLTYDNIVETVTSTMQRLGLDRPLNTTKEGAGIYIFELYHQRPRPPAVK